MDHWTPLKSVPPSTLDKDPLSTLQLTHLRPLSQESIHGLCVSPLRRIGFITQATNQTKFRFQFGQIMQKY